MRWRPREWTLVSVLLLAMPWIAAIVVNGTLAQSPAIVTTQITDTIYHADGTAATGTVLVSWPAFTTATGQTVSSGSTSATIGAGGALSMTLAPNAGATPIGSYYTAVFHLDDGSVNRQYWVVPASSSPVKLSAIESTVLPASVAMQTVSKSYVDTAIAAAVAGHPLDQSNPYVLKTGDTMTGPLVLPGDPTAATQAADKNYVDTNIASVASGLGQKVSLLPSGTQTVTQPAGTNLQVNLLNGSEYASQYVSGGGNNGITNAVTSSDCASGCDVKVEPSYKSNEIYNPQSWNSTVTQGTHVEDLRDGERRDSYLNPGNIELPGHNAGQIIDVTSTQDTAAVFQQTGSSEVFSQGLSITHEGLTGGSNLFPQDVEATVPYFKTTYSALNVEGTYNTLGQHVLAPHTINCYGVGDCLIGSQFITGSGGPRDNADEGTHPFDLQVAEDSLVFEGTCAAGCTTGSTTITVTSTSAPGTQGEGRFLINKNPAKVISTGQLVGATGTPVSAIAVFSGTSFPLSVFLRAAQAIPSQANNISPGTVTIAIATSGLPSGFATNTTALASQSGVACLADMPNSFAAHNYEMANYTVVDGTHLQMTLNKTHEAGATISVGGLCGYGLEQTVDTANGIRQVFPVLGAVSSTEVYYVGGLSSYVGASGFQSAYLNLTLPVASLVRSNNVVTATIAGNLPIDVNGLSMTVSGVTDGSYNGTYTVTTTGPTTLTYAETGADSTSSGGTISFLTGGYALYPMAEVLGVFDTATRSVDGKMTLAPNTVAWATNDPIEQPHYFQENVAADTEYVTQTTPRPAFLVHAGIQYQGNVGPGLHGFTINNAAPAANYFGNGGTHSIPDVAYEVEGVWKRTMEVQAGDESVFTVHCNSRGCGRWDSIYNLFELDNSAGTDTIAYQPTTSGLSLNLRGSSYSFTPQAFTAGTIDAGTISAESINASALAGTIDAARLPVFGPSGAAHAQGAVPDPGPVAGATRYLREDGAWSTPAGSGSSGVSTAPGSSSLAPGAIADYNFMEGTGSTLNDSSGNSNNGTLLGGVNTPVWVTNGLDFGGSNMIKGVTLPSALNTARSFLFIVRGQELAYGLQNVAYNVLLTSSNGEAGVNIMDDETTNTSGYLSGMATRLEVNSNGVYPTQQLGTSNGFHCKVVTLGSGSGDVDHLYIDGTEATYAAQAASYAPQTGNYFLGSGGAAPFQFSSYYGTMYRARFYASELTAQQVASTCAGMVAEVASRGVPTGVIRKTQLTPTLHAIGDSITCGWNATDFNCELPPYPSLLSLTNQPSYNIVNWGSATQPLMSFAAGESNRVAAQCSGEKGPVIASVLAGINDILYNNTITAATLLPYLYSEVAQLKAGGCLVFVGTLIANGSNAASGGTTQAIIDAYNALILSQWRGMGADGVIDFAANPLLGADGAVTNTTYFQSDGVHPTPAGQQLMANAMSNALNYYFGYKESDPHVVATLPYSMAAGDGEVDLAGLTAAGSLTLPDCTGQSGAVYRINNPQSTYPVTIGALNASQPINGLATAATVPANGTLTLRDVPNPKATGGCHWEY